MSTARPQTQFTSEEIRDALLAARGNLTTASAGLGMSRRRLLTRVQNEPELQAIVQSLRQEFLDKCESQLEAAVDRGEAWAICFSLKCLGKERGFVERVIVEHIAPQALEQLSMEQLDRLVAGEDPRSVLALPPGEVADTTVIDAELVVESEE